MFVLYFNTSYSQSSWPVIILLYYSVVIPSFACLNTNTHHIGSVHVLILFLLLPHRLPHTHTHRGTSKINKLDKSDRIIWPGSWRWAAISCQHHCSEWHHEQEHVCFSLHTEACCRPTILAQFWFSFGVFRWTICHFAKMELEKKKAPIYQNWLVALIMQEPDNGWPKFLAF